MDQEMQVLNIRQQPTLRNIQRTIGQRN